MSGRNLSDGKHPDDEALDRYRRRVAPPAETLAVDAHIAICDRCYDAVRAEASEVALPSGDWHVSYEELEAFVDGRADALDRELIGAHIADCVNCSGELADLAATRDSLPRNPPRAFHHVRSRRPRT